MPLLNTEKDEDLTLECNTGENFIVIDFLDCESEAGIGNLLCPEPEPAKCIWFGDKAQD